jgi:hypothetical protein
MKYFIDTEFIEGFHKPLFGKRRHFIDLISIGMVAEDGREYYAVSTDFRVKDCNDWVKKNVLPQLPQRHFDLYDSPRVKAEAMAWKSNKEILVDILDFTRCYRDQFFMGTADKPEFYGYYADYDWVLFCSLFGRMLDLPKGFPMYCRDLKQMMDEKGLSSEWKKEVCPDPEGEHNALVDAKWNAKLYQAITGTELQVNL